MAVPNNGRDTLVQNISDDNAFGGAFSPTFGNMSFQILPSATGEVSDTFGTIPYMSLEALIQGQASNAQTSPTNVLSGQTTGQMNIQGSYTVTDANGLVRMQMGYIPGGF